jgi:calcium/calmodulin-dependent 3',5'-cyclic nucleotide phosphodiesterase
MILATDMSFHFSQLKTIKNMISLNEPVDKPKALSLILHCADISHPAKEWHLHEVWTNSLVQEFFAQGDKEKELGLPFSPLCDRNNTPIAQSQIGFINFIVEPSMAVMGDMIDKLVEQITNENRPSSGTEEEK